MLKGEETIRKHARIGKATKAEGASSTSGFFGEMWSVVPHLARTKTNLPRFA